MRIVPRALQLSTLLVFVACGASESPAPPASGSAGTLPPGAQMPADHPPIPGGSANGGDGPTTMPPVPENAPVATVAETMNSGGYTYARLVLEADTMWAAGPQTESIAVGDKVRVLSGMGMRDFYSSSLDRTFEQILFLPAFPKFID